MDPDRGPAGRRRSAPTGRSRPRGAGRRCRCRRCGCRTAGRGGCSAIAEHSRCQPGKPSPQRGVGHLSIRPSPAAFQSAKSAGVALVGLDLAAMARPQRVERVPGQRAVVGERRDRVVDVAVVADVGVARVHQLLGELEHLGDVLGRPREDVRRQDVQQRRVGVERGLVGVGDLRRRLVLEAGRDEHPVLAAVEPLVAEVADVGDVLDVEHVDAVVEDDPPDEVGEEERPQVADVGVAVDGRAARVHPEPRGRRAARRARRARVRVLRRRSVTARSSDPRGRGSRAYVVCGISRECPNDSRAARYRVRGLAAMHRSPGGVDLRGLISCPAIVPKGASEATPPYTPAMRRWVCIVALLAGFSGDGYVRSARRRDPVAVERSIDPRAVARRGLAPHGGLVDRDPQLISTRRRQTARSPDRRPDESVGPADPLTSRRAGRGDPAVARRSPLAARRARHRPGAATTRSRSVGAADSARPGRPGRHRQCGRLRPAVREPDRLRRRPPDAAGARRVVGPPRRRADGSSSTSGPASRSRDGSPLTGDDVVRSWLRIIDPADPVAAAVA